VGLFFGGEPSRNFPMSHLNSLPTLDEVNRERRAQAKSALPTRLEIKGKQSRSEAVVKKAVRAACVERDGYCLVMTRLHLAGCKGRSEWAHLAGHRRSQTRGLPPSLRHDTRFTAMLCHRHHKLEEDDKFRVVYHSVNYADGVVSWEAV